ncbi:tol-pal system YbgF family protein [Nonomuraea sp. NPDC050556]|uniref:tol-pal system YbgF family protein n=1 Tax=Nonomuraea sp. NPDC050556 TaxID=3364369 RepID=UPI0037895F8F
MRRQAVVAAGVAALVVTAVGPALAHEHPSGLTDLVSPAVVRVEAVAHVDITLLDHVGELLHVERSYDIPIGTGTGVVVTPEGAVVTLNRVVVSQKDVAILAANRIFAEHHKVKIPADYEKHKVKDPILNHHLKECYPPKTPLATCIIDVKPVITVYPNIATPDLKGFQAEVTEPGNGPDSPAVLQLTGRTEGGAGLPTAPLADKVPDKEGSPINLAGFLAKPSADKPIKVEIGHLAKGGVSGEGGRPFADPEKKVDEPSKLGALADQGMLGAPIIGDKDGHVIGMLVGGGKDAKMIGVREITSALAKAKVVPRRGTIDAAFEAALTRFHTNNFTDAVPYFQRVIDLYPGHTVAAAHLKTSLAKRGGAEDTGVRKAAPPAKSGLPLWPFIALAAVVLVAALIGTFLLWRGRKRAEPPPQQPPVTPLPPPLVTSATPTPPPMMDDGANPTVVVRRSQAFQAVGQLVAQEQQPSTAIKYCTACGMRLGVAHKFCGYCGHPIET